MFETIFSIIVFAASVIFSIYLYCDVKKKEKKTHPPDRY